MANQEKGNFLEGIWRPLGLGVSAVVVLTALIGAINFEIPRLGNG